MLGPKVRVTLQCANHGHHSELENYCCEKYTLTSETKPLETACQPHIERHREKKKSFFSWCYYHKWPFYTLKILHGKIDCTVDLSNYCCDFGAGGSLRL